MKNSSPHRLRWVLAGTLIIALSALAVPLAPEAWVRLTTKQESSFGPLLDGDPLQGQARIRRFGARRWERHGPFRAEFAGGAIVGAYCDGEPSGLWRWEDGTGREIGRAIPLVPGSVGMRALGPVEVEIRADGGWRLSGCAAEAWAPAKGAEFLAIRYGDGIVHLGPAGFEESDTGGAPQWVFDGPLFELSSSGSVRRLGPQSRWGEDGLWTWFDDTGAIREQAVFRMGEEIDRRAESPWYDVNAGLDASARTVHPVTGRAVE